jgi:hypothetical protein
MVRISPVKLPCHADYDDQDTELCERVLLSVWQWLDDYHSDLVLIGGMVPIYLSEQNRDLVGAIDETYLAPRTMDVDVGIAVGAGGRLRDPISARLKHNGFSPAGELKGRFIKRINGIDVHIDFLAEKDPGGGDATMVDDVVAQAIVGVARAVATATTVEVTGTDLAGIHTTQRIRVAAAGPFICLKLQAYADPHRHAAKDIFDIVRTVIDHKHGFPAAISSFHNEEGSNPAYDGAADCLRDYFQDMEAEGPVAYASFSTNSEPDTLTDPDQLMIFEQRKAEAWDVARRLIGAEL